MKQEGGRACTNCGAEPTASHLRFCGYCGTELPESDARVAALVHAPLGDVEARFLALQSHESIPALLRQRPKTSSATSSMVGQGIVGLFMAGMALLMVFFFATVAGPLAVVPLIAVFFGLGLAISGFRKSFKFNAAPLQRMRAAVVDERVKVSGGGENSRTTTTYFASLQLPDGARFELEVSEEAAGALAPGDMGIAFVKGNYLIDFVRVNV